MRRCAGPPGHRLRPVDEKQTRRFIKQPIVKHIKHSRRCFFGHLAKLAIAGTVLPLPLSPRPAFAFPSRARTLEFAHTHTGERLEIAYTIDGNYVPDALTALSRFLRDHYTGSVGRMDPKLFDLLYEMKLSLRCDQPFQVISGYRCPDTNATLRSTSNGGVAKHSLHMEGKAIDIRLGGVPLADLRDAARSARAGGVGYYPDDQFVHVDTGRVRHW